MLQNEQNILKTLDSSLSSIFLSSLSNHIQAPFQECWAFLVVSRNQWPVMTGLLYYLSNYITPII